MHCLQMGNNINKTDQIRARPGENRKTLMGMKLIRNSGDCVASKHFLLDQWDEIILTLRYSFKKDFFSDILYS